MVRRLGIQKFNRFGLLFSARMAGAASLFAVNLLIARFLGLDALATYAICVSLISVLAIVVSTGFPAIAPVLVAEYSKKKQPELIKGFQKTALKRGGLLFAALLLCLLPIWLFKVHTVYFGSVSMVLTVMLGAAVTAILSFNGAVLVGMKKQILGLLPETFIRPVVFLLLALGSLATGIVSSIDQVLWLLTASICLTLVYVFIRDRKLRQKFSNLEPKTDTKRWKQASLPWMGISLLWDFMIDLVLLLTSLLAGSIEIAILHICFRYRVLAGFGMRTIHTLLMPEITEHAVSNDERSVKRKLRQLNSLSLIYSLGSIAGFLFLGDWLLGIFSIEADIALPVLLTISTTMVIRAIFGPSPLILAIHGFHLATLWVSFSAVLGATAFVIATFADLGIMAAAVGYTGANLAISVVLWYVAKRKTGIDCSILAGLFDKSSLIFRHRSAA